MPDRDRRSPKRHMILLRRVARMPFGAEHGETRTECPFWLENDDTAHALLMTDASFGPIVPNGVYVYLTQRRQPVVGDMLVLDLKDGSVIMRYLEKISDDGFQVISLPAMNVVRDQIKFSTIDKFAIVAGTRRI